MRAVVESGLTSDCRPATHLVPIPPSALAPAATKLAAAVAVLLAVVVLLAAANRVRARAVEIGFGAGVAQFPAVEATAAVTAAIAASVLRAAVSAAATTAVAAPPTPVLGLDLDDVGTEAGRTEEAEGQPTEGGTAGGGGAYRSGKQVKSGVFHKRGLLFREPSAAGQTTIARPRDYGNCTNGASTAVLGAGLEVGSTHDDGAARGRPHRIFSGRRGGARRSGAVSCSSSGTCGCGS